MPVTRYYSSTAQPTTLAGSISAGATSITVGATTGFPSTTPYTLALDYGAATEELVDVTGVAGTTLTVTRGADGTSAQSHSLGAAVRHVVSARDFADFQTHQATGSAVHGVSGTLVGTSDSQTLSNKTLSSPTIAGGALSGTFSGTPTWSGAHTFSATPALQAGVTVSGGDELVTRAATGNAAYRTRVTGDSVDRLAVLADGTHQWSSGAGGADVAIARVANTRLQLTAGQWSTAAGTRSIEFATAPADLKISTFVNGESVDRFQLLADGKLNWGGGAAALDTNLYRSAANILRTDDAFEAVSYIRPGASETIAGTPTAGTGFSLAGSACIRSGGVITWIAALTRTGGTITANSDGNVADFTLVTIPAGWLPPAVLSSVSSLPGQFVSTGTSGGTLLAGSGAVNIVDMNGSSSTISNGDTVRACYSYVAI
jgi:hypothetical protein